MTQHYDIEKTGLLIGDDHFTVSPIRFADIKEGDVIAHEVKATSVRGQANHVLWIGTALSRAQNVEEWYGNGRTHATHMYRDYWAKTIQNHHEDTLVAAGWHETEPGHRLWLVKQRVERKSIELDGETLELEKIEFRDIREGDTIVHLIEDEGCPAALWMGTVERKSEVSEQWYGNGRSQADANMVGEWLGSVLDQRDDVLIVADWHATEPGHSIWAVQGR